MLPGSGIQDVEEYTLQLLDHGLELMGREKLRSFFALCSGQEPAAAGNPPILVYNPHPYPSRTEDWTPVELPELVAWNCVPLRGQLRTRALRLTFSQPDAELLELLHDDRDDRGPTLGPGPTIRP